MRVKEEFYKADAINLAPKLLGKILCRKLDDGSILKARITETECYYGFDDSASHAYKGKTPRNTVMFNEGGVTYIYLCYGIHFLLNIVSGKVNHPEAVLIRGVEGFSGPGKVTKYLKIDKTLNYENLIYSDNLWLEDDGYIPEYFTTKRIGISYAKLADQDRLWRFVVKN